MAIIDLQRRLAETGRIRIGRQVPTSNGKTRPEKLDTFRLTSPDRRRIEQAAQLYGGEVQPWKAPAGNQFEVITKVDALNVIVPPSDMAFSIHYEMWSAGGCQRRCDGRTESTSDGPCLCDPDDRECDIHTRLSVMLRDLPGLGVWRIDTQGWYAALELQGAVEVIQMAAGRGQMLPARLRLEQRQVKRPEQPTRRFAVPVLDIEVSPGQLLSSSPPVRELTAGDDPPELDGSARLTPVPAALPSAPVPSVADQIAKAGQDQPKRRRRNAAQPIPATGLQPRTAAEATAELEKSTEVPVKDAPNETGDPITRAQLTKLHAQLNEFDIKERGDKLTTVSLLVRRQLDSSNDLTKTEASGVIDLLERLLTDKEPHKALDAVLAAFEESEQNGAQT
jgi:hypothetical protein